MSLLRSALRASAGLAMLIGYSQLRLLRSGIARTAIARYGS